MRAIHAVTLAGVSCLFSCPPVLAGGFNIWEMGSRATALGGAFTANAGDPSAVFYNPAGICWLPQGLSASAQVSPVAPRTRFARATGITERLYPGLPAAETEKGLFLPGGIYLTYRPQDPWGFGLGFFTPFGLAVEWEEKGSFAGRPLSTNARIQGFYLSPVVAFSPRPWISLAAGVNLVQSRLELDRIETRRGTDLEPYNVIDVELEGTSRLAASPSFGLLLRPGDRFGIGVSFKGGITNRFEDQNGTLTQRLTGFRAFDLLIEGQLDLLGREQEVSAELDYPAILATGIRYRVSERVAVEGDFVWFGWSAFDEVEIRFSNPLLDATLEERYQDGQQWRFGVEYQASDRIRGMIGFAYDNSPQPLGSVSPILPDADRLDYSLGVSFLRGRTEWTLGYMFVDFRERSTVVDGVGRNFDGFDGTYKSLAHIPTLGFTYVF